MPLQRWLACAVIASGVTGVGLALADARMPLRTPLVLLFLAAGAWSPDGGLVVVVVITALIEAVQLPSAWYTHRGRAGTYEVDNLTGRSQ